MKRQKRDRFERAHNKGYNAGICGKASETCPFTVTDVKEQWLGGWRAGRSAVSEGYFS
ncbi:MAG: ribosome modulation factor [Kangiellaceae bacterium]|nr:ribosome modulation factor [Kangiellaceae bacterium]